MKFRTTTMKILPVSVQLCHHLHQRHSVNRLTFGSVQAFIMVYLHNLTEQTIVKSNRTVYAIAIIDF